MEGKWRRKEIKFQQMEVEWTLVLFPKSCKRCSCLPKRCPKMAWPES